MKLHNQNHINIYVCMTVDFWPGFFKLWYRLPPPLPFGARGRAARRFWLGGLRCENIKDYDTFA